MNDCKKNLLIVLLIGIIVAGGIYIGTMDQDTDSEPTVETEEETAIETTEESTTTESSETPDPESITAEGPTITECSQIGAEWTRFSEDETTLSFCYNGEWGEMNLKETTIAAQFRIGTIWYVSVGSGDVPMVSYSTPDYEQTEGGDAGYENYWGVIDMDLSEAELSAAFSEIEAKYQGSAIVEKTSVNGLKALKVQREYIVPLTGDHAERVEYFIPRAEVNGEVYNLKISGEASLEEAIDKMAASLSF